MTFNYNKKKFSFIVGILICSLVVSSISFYVNIIGAEAESEWFETQTVVSANNRRIPTVAVTSDGTIFYAYEDTQGNGNSINLCTSTDNGSSWNCVDWFSSISGALSGGWWQNPLFFYDTSRERLFFFITVTTGDEFVDSEHWFRYTDNNGDSWSSWTDISTLKPAEVIASTNRANNEFGGCLTDNNTILIGMAGSTEGNSQHTYPYVIRSWDGENFYLGSELFASKAVAANENSLALCSNGSILCMARADDASGVRKYYSEDNGNTWTYCGLAFTGVAGNNRNSMLTYTTTDDTDDWRILLAFTNSSTRNDITVGVSYDDGATWTTRQVYNGGSAPDGSYPFLAKEDNHSILCAYEGDGYNTLHLAQFNLEWLTQGADYVSDVTPVDEGWVFSDVNGLSNNSDISGEGGSRWGNCTAPSLDNIPTVNSGSIVEVDYYQVRVSEDSDFSNVFINETGLTQDFTLTNDVETPGSHYYDYRCRVKVRTN